MRKAIAIGVVAAMAVVLPGAAQGRSGVRQGPADVACRYFKTINAKIGTFDVGRIAEVAPVASDAYAYGVFELDLRAASVVAGRDATRSVSCRERAVTVRLLQYSLPIQPKRVTTTYTAFETDARDHLVSFKVNGERPTGRLLVGSGQRANVLGTTVALSSAYQVVGRGGESVKGGNELLVILRATAPPDGVRDLATSAAEYRAPGGRAVTVHRVIAQGSPLQAGASGAFVLQFSAQPIGGDLTVPVLTAPAYQASADAVIEAAVVHVG